MPTLVVGPNEEWPNNKDLWIYDGKCFQLLSRLFAFASRQRFVSVFDERQQPIFLPLLQDPCNGLAARVGIEHAFTFVNGQREDEFFARQGGGRALLRSFLLGPRRTIARFATTLRAKMPFAYMRN